MNKSTLQTQYIQKHQTARELVRAFFGWLRWCWHGLPRRRECEVCQGLTWGYGPHSAFICSAECNNAYLAEEIPF